MSTFSIGAGQSVSTDSHGQDDGMPMLKPATLSARRTWSPRPFADIGLDGSSTSDTSSALSLVPSTVWARFISFQRIASDGFLIYPLSTDDAIQSVKRLRSTSPQRNSESNAFVNVNVGEAVLDSLRCARVLCGPTTYSRRLLGDTLARHGTGLPLTDSAIGLGHFSPRFDFLISPFGWLGDLIDWISELVERLKKIRIEPVPPKDNPNPPLPKGFLDPFEPNWPHFVRLADLPFLGGGCRLEGWLKFPDTLPKGRDGFSGGFGLAWGF